MLDFIRRNSDSAAVKIILGVLSLTFVFFFGSSALFGDRTEVWAEVNGEPIRDVEVTQVVRNRVRQQQQFNPDLGDDDIARIRQQVLDQMIEERLMLQAARDEGIVISDKEVRRAIMENPSFQDDEGKFDAELYRKIMKRNNAQSYERDVRESLLVQSVTDFIRRSARVSEAEVKDAFVEEASKREVDFIRVPTSLFKDEVVVSDEDATAWAVDHDAEITDRYDRDYDTKYNLPKKVRARHILMKYDEDAGDEDKAEVRSQMEAVLAEAKADGADFEALAKKYSEDGSAPRGGDLGLFDDKRMVKPFTEAAFSMDVGQVSDLVETQYGLHIIKVEEIQEAEEKQLADVKLEIAKELMKDERAPELAKAHAESLLSVLNGVVTGEEADALLAEKSLTIQSSGEFSRKDRRIPKLGVSKDALSAAFGLATVGDVTAEAVDLGTGYAIIKLTASTDADLAAFEEKKEEIRGRLLRTKQVRAVTAWRDQIKADARIKIAGGV